METLRQQGETQAASSRPHMQLRLVPQKQSKCLDIRTEESQEGRTQQYECCKAIKVCKDVVAKQIPSVAACHAAQADPDCHTAWVSVCEHV